MCIALCLTMVSNVNAGEYYVAMKKYGQVSETTRLMLNAKINSELNIK